MQHLAMLGSLGADKIKPDLDVTTSTQKLIKLEIISANFNAAKIKEA